jgi:hypothetical protein
VPYLMHSSPLCICMNNTPTELPSLTSVNGPFDKDVTESGARPATGTLGGLRIISYNTQKSWLNLTALLETHQSADVIIVTVAPYFIPMILFFASVSGLTGSNFNLNATSVVETGSHKHKGAVEDLDKVVLSGLKH